MRLHGVTVHYNQRPFFFTADNFVLYGHYGHLFVLVLFQLQIKDNGSVRFSKCYDVYIVAKEFDLTDVYVRECWSVMPPVLIHISVFC